MSDIKEEKTLHHYLVLPTALWELITCVRLLLGLGGSYGGNSPRLFLLMSSSPPCTSHVSWLTGVGWSVSFRSSLRMLWLNLDGSYFMVRALMPFRLLICRTGRTRPNLLTTQSWNQSTRRRVNTLTLNLISHYSDGTASRVSMTWPCVLVFLSPALQPSWWSCPRRLCSGSPAASVSCPRLQAAGDAAPPLPAALEPVWDKNTTHSLHTERTVCHWSAEEDGDFAFLPLKLSAQCGTIWKGVILQNCTYIFKRLVFTCNGFVSSEIEFSCRQSFKHIWFCVSYRQCVWCLLPMVTLSALYQCKLNDFGCWTAEWPNQNI